MVGLGTDEESLTMGIVSRAEVDLNKVKEYKVRYGKTVTNGGCSDTSGTTRTSCSPSLGLSCHGWDHGSLDVV